MDKKISVILVNYNGKEYNDKCIRSILNSTVQEKLEIVVVDNASTDGSLEELKQSWKEHEKVHILPLDANYGFSKANNEGIRWASEHNIEYFFLLNNDTEIEPDAIEKIYRLHEQTKGIIVPKVLYAEKKEIIWCAGGEFSPIVKKAVQRGLNQQDKGQFSKNAECHFANGCALFLSKDIVKKIGYLDERFFLYYEDTEYSMRAVHHGISIWYCADAVVYHKVNGSTKGNAKPANAYYIARNWLLCNSQHMNKGKKKILYIIFLLYYGCNRFAWHMIWFCSGKTKMCTAQLQGIMDYRRKRWGKYESHEKR